MKRIIDYVIKHKKLVVVIFGIATILTGISTFFVTINYDLQAYLPENTESTNSLEVMSSQFVETIFNVDIMLPNANISEVLEMKETIKEKDYVLSVFWLDDYIDVTIPVDVYDQEIVNQYYKDNNALFMVTVETENYPPVLSELQEIVGEDGYVAGRMVELAMAQSATQSEISQIVTFAIPIVLIILLLATSSWIEPLVMLLSIGVGIVLNMGTNIIFPSISFLTQAVAAILQLAVSMDYAIFLLHRFADYRITHEDTEEAMRLATQDSLPTLMASSITTFIGFLALVLMRFQIGPDLGLVLAKGVLFSLISVLFLLPSLTIILVKWIDKTTHKSFLPSFNWIAKINYRLMPVILILVMVITVPSFLAQRKNEFNYGMGDYQENSREKLDQQAVIDVYGENTQMVILVPKGQWANENAMIQEFLDYPEVQTIMSYSTMIGANIPYEILPENQISSLISKDYSRIILQVKSKSEGEHAFNLVERVRETISKHYDEETHLIGETVITYDMAETIKADDFVVNGIAILAIFLTILLTFKSLSVPVILVFAIELSIWINLSFPYFAQSPLNYIGYLIISTVQLGATVDYGVLYTQNYLENRQKMDKKTAFFTTINQSAQSILPPALILTVVGFILGIISSIKMVSELGFTLGRGALLSMLMVLFFVPIAYYVFDTVVAKTTIGFKSFGKEDSHEKIK